MIRSALNGVERGTLRLGGNNLPSPRPLYAGTLMLAVVMMALLYQQYDQSVRTFADKEYEQLRIRVEGFSVAQRVLIESRLNDIERDVRLLEPHAANPAYGQGLLRSINGTLRGVVWLTADGAVLSGLGPGTGSERVSAIPTTLPALWPGATDDTLLLFLEPDPSAAGGARYLVAVVDAEVFGQAIDALGTVAGTSVGVMTPEGRVVLRRPVIGSRPAVVESARSAVDRTFREVSPFDGQERLISLRVSDDWSLRIAVTTDLGPLNREVDRYRNELSRRRLAVATAVLGLIALVTLLAARHIRAAASLRETIRRNEQIRAELAKDEELFRSLFETATISIMIRDYETGTVLEANERAVTSRGLRSTTELREYARFAASPFAREDELQWIHRARTQGPQRYEWMAIRADGGTVWEDMFLQTVELGGRRRLVAIAVDVTDRHRIEERMRHLAQHDALTGLPNRALFADRLSQAIVSAARDKETVAILFVDLDNFKPINDSYGHAAGDIVLRKVAERLRGTVRASDTVGRIGGDEFVVLLPKVEDVAAATVVAEKTLSELVRPITHDGLTLQVSASIGVALHPQHGATGTELMRNADAAMYAAKEAGRNRVRIYENDIRQ